MTTSDQKNIQEQLRSYGEFVGNYQAEEGPAHEPVGRKFLVPVFVAASVVAFLGFVFLPGSRTDQVSLDTPASSPTNSAALGAGDEETTSDQPPDHAGPDCGSGFLIKRINDLLPELDYLAQSSGEPCTIALVVTSAPDRDALLDALARMPATELRPYVTVTELPLFGEEPRSEVWALGRLLVSKAASPGGQLALLSGTLELTGECLTLVTSPSGGRTAIIWPLGTEWLKDSQEVRLSDGTLFALGDEVTGGGGGTSLAKFAETEPVIAEQLLRCERTIGAVATIHFDGGEPQSSTEGGAADMAIWIHPAATPQQVNAVAEFLNDHPSISEYAFLSQEEAMAEFDDMFQDSPDLLDAVAPEDLPARYRVILLPDVGDDVVASLLNTISNMDGVRDVVKGLSPTTDDWDALAQCESSGDWSAVSASGTFRGGLQFTIDSWESAGGVGDPADAPKDEQIERAQTLWEQRGSAPWPKCAEEIGLPPPL